MTPTFQSEVQFRRWSDSSTQGVQVTFALPDSDALGPLKGLEGKRFMAVLVQIGDDEQPVPPQPKKDRRGPLCREACDYCAMADFQEWVCSLIEQGRFRPPEGLVNDSEAAKWFIFAACDIGSRKHLDEIPAAADRFISNIRLPFMRWQREQRQRSPASIGGEE
jgi:hypothetical protein